jgi:hypothetical protein
MRLGTLLFPTFAFALIMRSSWVNAELVTGKGGVNYVSFYCSCNSTSESLNDLQLPFRYTKVPSGKLPSTSWVCERETVEVPLVYRFSAYLLSQLGIAVGFVLPPILVKNHDDLDLIGRDLQFMFYSVAGFTTILVVLVVFCEHNCLQSIIIKVI